MYDPTGLKDFQSGTDGWKEDPSFQVHCFQESRFPNFDCKCSKMNLTSSGMARKYHRDKLGKCFV